MPSPSVPALDTAKSLLCGISVRRPSLSGPLYLTWKPVCCGRACSSSPNSGTGWVNSTRSW